jgi:hypothetical protein
MPVRHRNRAIRGLKGLILEDLLDEGYPWYSHVFLRELMERLRKPEPQNRVLL